MTFENEILDRRVGGRGPGRAVLVPALEQPDREPGALPGGGRKSECTPLCPVAADCDTLDDDPSSSAKSSRDARWLFSKSRESDLRIAEPINRSSRCLHEPKYEQMWVVSLLYLFHGLGSATWGRFSCIYYLTKGLSTFEIGIIEGLMPLMKMVCGPTWGYLADRLRSKKYVYLFSRATSSSILILLAFPQIARGFISILILSMLNVSFVAMGVLEAYAIEVCGREKQKYYGRLRLWQSIAAGLGAVLMGYLTDNLGFTANFIGWGLMALMNCALIAWKIPNRTDDESAAVANKEKIYIGQFCGVVYREAWFFMLIIVFGMGIGVIDKLLFVFLTTELNASTTFCGVTVAVTVLIEIPLFFFGKKLLSFFGRDLLVGIAMAAYVVRVFGYTILTPETKWMILVLEVLHGVGFSNVWMVSIDYSSDIVPQGWASTMQTFLRSLYLSVGAGVGAVCGGWLMQHFGARFMYMCYGTLMLCFLFAHAALVFSGLFSFDAVGPAKMLAEGYSILGVAASNQEDEEEFGLGLPIEEEEEDYVSATASCTNYGSNYVAAPLPQNNHAEARIPTSSPKVSQIGN